MDAEAWDERYRSTRLLWSAEPNVFVEDRLREVPPGVGIDLASGEGRNALWLASLGWEMIAVDFSSVALDRGREMSSGAVDFIEADVFAWEPERLVDLVLIAYLQVGTGVLCELIERAVEWLNPGGQLFMIGHDMSNIDDGIGGPQVPEVLWDLDLLVQCVSPRLEILEDDVVERPVEVDGDIMYARDTLLRAMA